MFLVCYCDPSFEGEAVRSPPVVYPSSARRLDRTKWYRFGRTQVLAERILRPFRCYFRESKSQTELTNAYPIKFTAEGVSHA